MSTKLNAEELAAKRYPNSINKKLWEPSDIYATAIREVAQPIADERDELREALEAMVKRSDDMNFTADCDRKARAYIAKATHP